MKRQLAKNFIGRSQLEDIASRSTVQLVTVGEKRVGGRRTGQVAAIAYVLRKQDVSLGERIPKTLSIDRKGKEERLSIVTDVVELPSAPQAFGVRSGHVIQGYDGDVGVCGLSFVKSNQRYFLTNAHVVANVSWGGNSGPVRLFDRQTQSYISVGSPVFVSALVPGQIAAADVAVIKVIDGVQVDPLRVLDFSEKVVSFGAVSGSGAIQYWYSVNGAIHTCAYPEPVNIPAPARVDNTVVRYVSFWQLQMIQGAALPGHSGALLCRSINDNIEACGLVFGGSPPSYVWVFPFRAMWQFATAQLP